MQILIALIEKIIYLQIIDKEISRLFWRDILSNCLEIITSKCHNDEKIKIEPQNLLDKLFCFFLTLYDFKIEACTHTTNAIQHLQRICLLSQRTAEQGNSGLTHYLRCHCDATLIINLRSAPFIYFVQPRHLCHQH